MVQGTTTVDEEYNKSLRDRVMSRKQGEGGGGKKVSSQREAAARGQLEGLLLPKTSRHYHQIYGGHGTQKIPRGDLAGTKKERKERPRRSLHYANGREAEKRKRKRPDNESDRENVKASAPLFSV